MLLKRIFYRKLISGIAIAFPPAIANYSHNGKGRYHQVKYATIKPEGRLFAQLLRCFCTHGTLCCCISYRQSKQKNNN